MALADLLSQLDPRVGVRGRQFERLCGWYLRNAPEYRDRIRRVWLWSEWPGAWPGGDAGIDLVAEENDGALWAIQAKAYDPDYWIKKADVDSFLSESSRPQFSFRLLIATTDNLGPRARRTLDAQREPVTYLLRSQLELAQVAWPPSFEDLRPRRPARKKPFPHVREAITATVKGFADQQRGQLIMACGTGKTLAAMWIAERLESNRTLVLVPSLSLLAQTLREWCANASEPFEYLAVCSDPTVVGEDQLVEHTAELGFPTTTEPSAIAAFLRRRTRRVVFATYQSSPQIAAAFGDRTPQFDLAVADEAHRCAGRTSNEFATILDAGKIKSRRRLFMTATPRFYTPGVRREAGQLGVEVASMDNEEVFGPVLHRLTFGEAIERDLLSDYQVVVVGVDNETYRSWAERGEFVTPDGEKVTDARTLAGQIGLVKTIRKYSLKRVISFHSRIKAARKFSEDVPYVSAWMPAHARPQGAIWSEHVSGQMTSGQRDRLLLRFRNLAPDELGLLCNARCLGEGVDVPSIDGIAFIDPRRSTIDIVQALGRAIRKSADKRVGTIVLPVFLSPNEDPDEALNESAFEHVWDVLKALRAHDERLGEELDELRRRLGAHRGAPRRPGKIKMDVPRTVGAEFARTFDVRLVEQTTASWEFFFGLLQRFVEREGHARVPQGGRAGGYREDGYRLGQWVNVQRTLRARGDLDPGRQRQLEGVSGWTWDVREAAWEEGFRQLQQYVKREGHARVPVANRENGFRLGSWVNTQRTLWAQGDLDLDRGRQLEGLSGWTWNVLETAWEEGFGQLHRFVEREGHSRVPDNHKENGFGLGSWVGRQRTMKRNGMLSGERAHRLEALPGWSWTVQRAVHRAAWEGAFARLQRFVEREGHARVPKGTVEDGFRLGGWVSKQRDRQARGVLNRDRRRRLEGLPGWTWTPFDDAWEQGLAQLRKFIEREGHARVPKAHRENGFKLGLWVNDKRSKHARGLLPQDRVESLATFPEWIWDDNELRWEEGLRHLRRFVEREGHARVPYKYVRDGFRLGKWVDERRSEYRDGRIPDRRVKALEAEPGWVWHAKDAAWNEMYGRLSRFYEREGHSRVHPSHVEDGVKLGSWVVHQRMLGRQERIRADRRLLLERIPDWVWSFEDERERNWLAMFERLRKYAIDNGTAQVPLSYRDGEVRLGSWVNKQRAAYSGGRISAERVERLESLPGWVWDARHVTSAR